MQREHLLSRIPRGVKLVLFVAGVLLFASGIVSFLVLQQATRYNVDTSDFNQTRDPGPADNLRVVVRWPSQVRESGSATIQLTLVIDGSTDGVQVMPGQASASTQIPVPAGFVLKDASARIEGKTFGIGSPSPELQQPNGRTRLTWNWNLSPQERGRHLIDLELDVTVATRDGRTSSQLDTWTNNLAVDVSKPSALSINVASIVSIAVAVIGPILSSPWLLSLLQERRRRKAET